MGWKTLLLQSAEWIEQRCKGKGVSGVVSHTCDGSFLCMTSEGHLQRLWWSVLPWERSRREDAQVDWLQAEIPAPLTALRADRQRTAAEDGKMLDVGICPFGFCAEY